MDWSSIIVGGLAVLGTVLGSAMGIREANKLVTYRLTRLEEKVDRHNCVIERTYALEQGQALLEEKLRETEHRMDRIQKEREKSR